MALRFKEGVSVRGMRPELAVAFQVASEVYARFACDAWVTSVTDGEHMEGSLHYEGLAADFRTRIVAPHHRQNLADLMRTRLGSEWDVVLEEDHLHVEHDPPARTV